MKGEVNDSDDSEGSVVDLTKEKLEPSKSNSEDSVVDLGSAAAEVKALDEKKDDEPPKFKIGDDDDDSDNWNKAQWITK